MLDPERCRLQKGCLSMVGSQQPLRPKGLGDDWLREAIINPLAGSATSIGAPLPIAYCSIPKLLTSALLGRRMLIYGTGGAVT